MQYLLQQFWSRWRKQYLLHQSARQRWREPRRNIKVGDVVALVEDSPRMEWPLAIITETKIDEDGLVRRIKARRSTTELDKRGKPMKQAAILERPVQKVVVLLESRLSKADATGLS